MRKKKVLVDSDAGICCDEHAVIWGGEGVREREREREREGGREGGRERERLNTTHSSVAVYSAHL